MFFGSLRWYKFKKLKDNYKQTNLTEKLQNWKSTL